MRKKLFLPFLLLSGLSLNQALAQCTATLTSSGDCYPFTLTANANFAMDTIIWKKDNAVVQTYIATLGNGVVVAGGNGQGSAANQFNQPTAMCIDATGNIYVVDGPNHRIQKWAPNATTGVTVAGGNGQGSAANQFSFPSGLYVDDLGNMYITDCLNARVQKWAPNATSGVTVAGGNGWGSAANQLMLPGGVFVKDGDVYIMDSDNARVQKWAPNATAGITVAGGNGWGTAANQIANPSINGHIFVDANSNIYISEYSAFRVSKWAPNATTGVVVAGGNGQGSAANQLNYPSGLFVDNTGGVFISEYGNHRVQFWPANATLGTTVAGGNGAGPALNQTSQATGVVKSGNDVYVLEYGNHRVTKFSAGTVITNTYTVTEPGEYKAIVKNAAGCADSVALTFDFPEEILISPAGTLHLCDGDNETLSATTHSTLSYQWQKDGFNIGTNTNTLTIDETGLYKVITNVNGNCIDTTDIVTASFHDLPAPVITNTNNVLSTGTFDTYQWYRNTVLIPGATASTYTPTENGNYTVKVTNEHDCEATSAIVEVTGLVGVRDIALLDGISVYPNPTRDAVYLNIPLSITSVTVDVVNLQGQLVFTQDVVSSSSPVVLNLNTVQAGVYFLKMNAKEGTKTFKITKY